jgi:lipid II:glycine glycyltransferase (peptidoglycan interpeptide bridge formation enzyme)
LLSIRPLASNDSPQWEKFILECPNATIFHTLEWQTILSEGVREELTVYWGLWSNDELVAIWPTSLVPAFGGKILFSLPHSNFGHPIISNNCDPSLLIHMLNCIREQNRSALHLSVDLLRNSKLSEAIGSWGYDVRPSPKCTFTFDTKPSADEMWKRLSKKARNAVRQGRSHGLKLEEATMSDLKEYFELYKSTMRRHYRMGVDWEFYAGMYSTLVRTHKIKIVLARYEGKTIAGVVLLTLNQKAYWFGNASLTEYWKYRPNEFLLWSVYEWANRNGISSIDLGLTTADSSDGLHLFKRHMGGRQVDLLRLTIPINRVRNLLVTNIIRTYRKMEHIVPGFVVGALQPRVWFDE